MKKYAMTQDIVTRLTENRTLRTFFTLYLMAESEEEKARISARFRRDADALETPARAAFFADFAASFRKLPELAGDLLERVKAAKRETSVAMAA